VVLSIFVAMGAGFGGGTAMSRRSENVPVGIGAKKAEDPGAAHRQGWARLLCCQAQSKLELVAMVGAGPATVRTPGVPVRIRDAPIREGNAERTNNAGVRQTTWRMSPDFI
jgi:hypothetical protein